jgi:hypothetical protein
LVKIVQKTGLDSLVTTFGTMEIKNWSA